MVEQKYLTQKVEKNDLKEMSKVGGGPDLMDFCQLAKSSIRGLVQQHRYSREGSKIDGRIDIGGRSDTDIILVKNPLCEERTGYPERGLSGGESPSRSEKEQSNSSLPALKGRQATSGGNLATSSQWAIVAIRGKFR